LNKLDTICLPSYLLTLDDMLRVFRHTSGICEVTSPLAPAVNFASTRSPLSVVLSKHSPSHVRLLDQGGSRCQRRRWLYTFEEAAGIFAHLILISILNFIFYFNILFYFIFNFYLVCLFVCRSSIFCRPG
jgi:hypothetical protein